MTDTAPSSNGRNNSSRTIAIRVSDDIRAQLDIVAQLSDRSVSEEVRLALESWLEQRKSDPEVLRKAASVRADLEREAQVKSEAINALFASQPAALTNSSARAAAGKTGVGK